MNFFSKWFSSVPKVRRINPSVISNNKTWNKFEFKKTPVFGIFSSIFGILFIIGAFCIFLFTLYLQLLQDSFVYILQLINPKSYNIPLWFIVIVGIITLPWSIFFILLVHFIKIILK